MARNARFGPKDYLQMPYARVLTPDEDTGTYTAEILEFPGCIAQGNTVEEAYDQLESAAESWIAVAIELGQTIPPPSAEAAFSGRYALRLPRSLHRRAAQAAEKDETSLNQFIVAAIAERVGATTFYRNLAAEFTDRIWVKMAKQVCTNVFHQILNIEFDDQVARTGAKIVNSDIESDRRIAAY